MRETRAWAHGNLSIHQFKAHSRRIFSQHLKLAGRHFGHFAAPA
jgi:hypothetical protein